MEAMATEMAQVREQLASVPAAVVVANHAMGLYELAAIHLRQQPPNLAEAKVAIDAFGALSGSLEGPPRRRRGDPRRRPATSCAWPTCRSSGVRRPATTDVTILVTGGAGYIGSHTARLLRQRDETWWSSTPSSSVRLTRSWARPWSWATSPTPTWWPAPSRARRRRGRALRRLQGGGRVDGTARALLRQQRRAGPTPCSTPCTRAGVDRFVFSSTCAVYGTPTELPVSEDHRLHPESPYGESKRMVEQMLDWYDTCHGLRSVRLRYFNAAGASDDAQIGEDWTVTLNLVPLVMKAAAGRRTQPHRCSAPTTRPPTAPPSATTSTSTTWPTPTCEPSTTSSRWRRRRSRQPRHRHRLVGATGHRRGRARQRASKVPVVYGDRRAGDPVQVYGDNRKAAELLGWKPQRDLQDIVASAWRWHSR